jgi:hypothetical protein
MKKYSETTDDKDHSAVENLEQYIDMDIRAGMSQESDKISQNPFLSRGLSDVPVIDNVNCEQYQYSCCKLATYDWISMMDISIEYLEFPIAEVRFKNSHKDFFLLPETGVYKVGDIVAVEATPGHDIGIISMVGVNVKNQLKNRHLNRGCYQKNLSNRPCSRCRKMDFNRKS